MRSTNDTTPNATTEWSLHNRSKHTWNTPLSSENEKREHVPKEGLILNPRIGTILHILHMDRLTRTVSRVLSSLSASFPDCRGNDDDMSFLVVFSSHSSNASDDTLIRESAMEGERFSQFFTRKHGENCSLFMESPIVDAVVCYLELDM